VVVLADPQTEVVIQIRMQFSIQLLITQQLRWPAEQQSLIQVSVHFQRLILTITSTPGKAEEEEEEQALIPLRAMLHAIMEILRGHLLEVATVGIFLDEVPLAAEVAPGFNRGTEASVTFTMAAEEVVVDQLQTRVQMMQTVAWAGRTTPNIGTTHGMVQRPPLPLETPHITPQSGNHSVGLVD
jgi:hypothetical protein